jgi:hypothetical protein
MPGHQIGALSGVGFGERVADVAAPTLRSGKLTTNALDLGSAGVLVLLGLEMLACDHTGALEYLVGHKGSQRGEQGFVDRALVAVADARAAARPHPVAAVGHGV